MTVKEICDIMEARAPLALAPEYDNSGLILGDDDDAVNKVLVTLDVTPDTVDEARAKGCDMIISHHPPIFHAVKKLGINDFGGYVAAKAARAGISLYASHLPSDCCRGGINDALCGLLGVAVSDGEDRPYRIGSITRIRLEELTARVTQALGDGCTRTVGDSDKCIDVVCVSSGAGGRDGEFNLSLIDGHVDALITSEVKHSLAVEAKYRGLAIIEVNHYDCEKVFVDITAEYLAGCGVMAERAAYANPYGGRKKADA